MNPSVISTVICYQIEFLTTFVFACGFLRQFHKQNALRLLIIIVPLSFMETLIEIIIPQPTNAVFLNMIVLFFFIWYIFRLSPLHTILLTVIVFCTCMTVQLLLVLLFSVTNVSFHSTFQGIIANSLTLAVSVLLAKFCKLGRLFDLLISRSQILIIGILNLSGVMLMINIYNKMFHTSLADLVISFLFPLLTLFFINAVIFTEYVHDQRKQKEKEAYLNYLPLIDEMIDQIRARQHKFDNELQAIRLLPTTYHDYDSLCKAMSEYSGFIIFEYQDSLLLKLNLKCLSAFLFQKLHLAKQQRKTIHLTVRNPLLSSTVPEYELINMIGILVDNMIESISENNEAELILDSCDNSISVTTLNPGPLLTPDLRKSFFEKGYSTKSSTGKRGYGLYLLQESIAEYGGKIYLENIIRKDIVYVKFEIKV